jgi:drug/metabolite transporter (DMT)-like permease
LLASLEPVWGIIFGILLLRELPTPITLLGGALILAAILLPGILSLVLPRSKLSKEAE